MLLTRAAYGLVQAPLQWYKSVCNTLKTLGYLRLTTEPCCWILQDNQGQVRSAVHGHVDDFMVAGKQGDPIHETATQALKQKYNWGAWETNCFEQCGLEAKQHEDFSISLRQSRFIDDLEEISLSRDRSRQGEQPTTDKEKSWLRGTLGSLLWLCGQTCFMYSANVSFLISTIPVSTVSEVIKTNTVVRNVKKWRNQQFWIHAFPEDETLHMICWTDAAFANRPNEKDSTEGIFVGLTTKHVQQGRECDITPVHWRSAKISSAQVTSVCRDSGGN